MDSLDLERERPKNYIEIVSGDDSWKLVGFRIKWTEPTIPSGTQVKIGEPLRLRVAVEAKEDVTEAGDQIEAYCWTNMRFRENTAGLWKDIKLHENPKCYEKDATTGIETHIFYGSLAPAHDNCYRLTFNLKWKRFMVWANDFQIDNVLDVVAHPYPEMEIQAPVHQSCGQTPGKTRTVTVPVPKSFHEPAVHLQKSTHGSTVHVQKSSHGSDTGVQRDQTASERCLQDSTTHEDVEGVQPAACNENTDEPNVCEEEVCENTDEPPNVCEEEVCENTEEPPNVCEEEVCENPTQNETEEEAGVEVMVLL